MKTTIVLLLSLAALACGSDPINVESGDTERSDTGSMTAPSTGSAAVTLGGLTRDFTRWDSRFVIAQEDDAPATLTIIISAAQAENADRNFVTVTIQSVKQLEPGPFNLEGTYQIKSVRSPLYSGVVAMRWDGDEIDSPSSSEGVGMLTITSHKAGRIEGSLTSALADGSEVRASFEGEITGSCKVLSPDDEDGSEAVNAPFDDPFCAQYMQ